MVLGMVFNVTAIVMVAIQVHVDLIPLGFDKMVIADI